MQRAVEFEEKLKNLPSLPGVYLMKNKAGKIIYVGKSKCLKNRVSSYFSSYSNLTRKTSMLVFNIYDFDIIVTSNEVEALILENKLIKKYNPKYNIKLKDAKTYPYIRINTESDFPTLSIAHTKSNKNSKYFGPYTSSIAAKNIIKTLENTFRIPDCKKSFTFGKKVCRPCLNYHMEKCIAPCDGTVTKEQYVKIIDDIILVLKGEWKSVAEKLEKQMNSASQSLNFEKAAKLRDSISNLKRLSEKQLIEKTSGAIQDYIGFFESDAISAVCFLKAYDGVVQNKDTIFLTPDEISDEYMLCDLIQRYYHSQISIPREIYMSFEADDEQLFDLENTLSSLCGHKVTIKTSKKGDKKSLCEMAVSNARQESQTKLLQYKHDDELLYKIAKLLNLETIPERIESYDISNSGNSDMYCGMIVVKDGKFSKKDYRSFSIKNQDFQDDYGAMKQALDRRCNHLFKEDDESMTNLPDLILLDGGVGHVSTIKQLFFEKGIEIPVFGMVKDQYHKTRTLTDGENQISIAKDKSVFSFFYKIQEEVHRYTFSKMDASRRKKVKTSSLSKIKGIGEEKAKALIMHFGSIDNIKNASIEELVNVKGISVSVANNIIEYFKNGELKQ